MARTRPTRAVTVPGAGTMFALRAIGLVILARWLHSMAQMNFIAALEGMASSPVACLNLVFLFLLIVLPGAKARVERPFHPLPQWLRQALRFFGVFGCLFALWSIGAFVWMAGWRRAVHAAAETNGWLVVLPALYAAVVWICRPRALWRSNFAARRFAIGRYAVSIDVATRTTVVWLESRKLGQYDARELSVRWPGGARVRDGSNPGRAGEPGGVGAAPVSEPVGEPVIPAHAPLDAETTLAASAESAAPVVPAAPATAPTPSTQIALIAPVQTAASSHDRRPKIALMWDSPAAAGHNRQTVFRIRLMTEGDRVAARALDAALKQA
ncbi:MULTISPECIES: hypothetical protein [Paraburkholderia]|uniref:hypothetical protein n=1 Tax=Paraburkholderia TaxID=1822464 RepID=UPI0007EDE2DD|nr:MULTISPECIES: hypothetical protein [Paraburkholderia]MBB2979489.1 hypothetical protein [Paraburkholderia tropica]OBR50182.1 hypothetical protein A6456_17500 [Paraburkholderia tropica]RQM49395.1 hypothetical protein EHZ19_07075 [Paraburkholderia bannensis]